MKPLFIEIFGRVAGVLAGSVFSPSWLFIHWVISPYVDVNALVNPDTMVSASVVFAKTIRQLSSFELMHLFAMLVLGIIVSIGYLILCAQLGRSVVKWIVGPQAQTA